MRTLDAGPEGIRLPGQTYEVPAEEAEQLVSGGYAEPVATPAPPTANVARENPADEADGESNMDEERRDDAPEETPEKREPETATREAPEDADRRPRRRR